MAIVIKPKRSDVANSVPTTSDIAVGELAVNTSDQVIYVRNGSGSVVAVANYADVSTVEASIAAITFPVGDYEDFSALEVDPFGQTIDRQFDCLTSPTGGLAVKDLGVL